MPLHAQNNNLKRINYRFCGEHEHNKLIFLFYLNLKDVPINLAPGKSSHIRQTKQFEAAEKQFEINSTNPFFQSDDSLLFPLSLIKLLIVEFGEFMHKTPCYFAVLTWLWTFI